MSPVRKKPATRQRSSRSLGYFKAKNNSRERVALRTNTCPGTQRKCRWRPFSPMPGSRWKSGHEMRFMRPIETIDGALFFLRYGGLHPTFERCCTFHGRSK
jgi:hypothetical protein